MTLTELDTLIDATPAAGAMITSYVDWFALFDPLPEGAIMEWDGLEYRDLPVWVAMPGETRVVRRLRRTPLELAGVPPASSRSWLMATLGLVSFGTWIHLRKRGEPKLAPA